MGGNWQDPSLEQLLTETSLVLIERKLAALLAINALVLFFDRSKGQAVWAFGAGHWTAHNCYFLSLFRFSLRVLVDESQIDLWGKPVLFLG